MCHAYSSFALDTDSYGHVVSGSQRRTETRPNLGSKYWLRVGLNHRRSNVVSLYQCGLHGTA